MNFRLRHCFYFPIALCLLASCSADEPTAVSSRVAMEFSVGAETRSSRADSYILSPFSVYCDMKNIANGTLLQVMENVPVTYNYSNGAYEYDETQYWYPDREYSFVALHPVSVLSAHGANTLYAGSELSFIYSIPASSGNEIAKNDVLDILAATHRRYYSQESDVKPVTFRFGHLMSLINIAPAVNCSAMGRDEYVRFKKIELTGLKNSATIRILPSPILSNSQTDDRSIDISNQEGDTKMTVVFDDPKKIKNQSVNVSLFDADDALIMLPQEFDVDSQAKIILTYTLNEETEERVISAPLSLMKWDSGKSYTYNFTYDGTHLLLESTAINDWVTKDKPGFATSE